MRLEKLIVPKIHETILLSSSLDMLNYVLV